MLDKNGVEIRTGMVVEITGAYFKNDNGLWFVENSPGDPSWCGSDYCLKKISKAGKVSVAKDRICFWPIAVFVSDRCKAAEASRWNKDHAEIEARKIKNVAGVAAHFRGLAEAQADRVRWTERRFGADHPEAVMLREMVAHFQAVADAVEKGER